MVFDLFSVHDVKASIFMSPFVARSSIDACRQIMASFSRPEMLETPVGRYPEDFRLYRIGLFDDADGLLKPISPPALVAEVLSLREAALGGSEGSSTVRS